MTTILETVDMAELLEEAYELAEMINNSTEVSAYLQAKQQLAEDQQAQQLLRVFQKQKEQYEEVQRFGKYHPDFHKVSTEIRESKRALEQMESVKAFKQAENNLDEMLYNVSRIIADAVSPNIKVPSNNPFLEAKMSGCGNGGSCGCGSSKKKRKAPLEPERSA